MMNHILELSLSNVLALANSSDAEVAYFTILLYYNTTTILLYYNTSVMGWRNNSWGGGKTFGGWKIPKSHHQQFFIGLLDVEYMKHILYNPISKQKMICIKTLSDLVFFGILGMRASFLTT